MELDVRQVNAIEDVSIALHTANLIAQRNYLLELNLASGSVELDERIAALDVLIDGRLEL